MATISSTTSNPLEGFRERPCPLEGFRERPCPLEGFRERLADSAKVRACFMPTDQMTTFFRAVCDNPTFLTMLLQYRENLCQTEADKANFDKIMNFVVANYTTITPLGADWGYYHFISQMKEFMPVPFGDEVTKINTWRFAKGLPQFQRLPQCKF